LRQAGIKSDAVITIAGYTSRAGTKASNLRLSTRRAQAIARQVRELLPGIAVNAVGLGERRNKACDRFENRCVVISVTQSANR
jgi:outer membrane protein OmpA-like peptidoglycan-associated protein